LKQQNAWYLSRARLPSTHGYNPHEEAKRRNEEENSGEGNGRRESSAEARRRREEILDRAQALVNAAHSPLDVKRKRPAAEPTAFFIWLTFG
jgi:hypothetical protein